MYKNLRWKVLTILAVLVVFGGIGVYPLLAQSYSWPLPGWLQAKALKLGLDLKGGVQLVAPGQHRRRAADVDRRRDQRAAARVADDVGHHAGDASASIRGPTTFRVEGVPQDATRSSAPRRTRSPATNYDRNPLARRQLRVRDEADRSSATCASRPSSRRCRRSIAASTSSASPSRRIARQSAGNS